MQHSNPKIATGYDQIPPRILKECAKQLAVPITHLYNESIRQSKFPTDHKAAEVGPHHKNDSRSKENYRPVCILTSLSNIFEKIMDNQLSELKTRVFSDVLSAFRPGYSTQYVLMNLVEKMKICFGHT